MKKTTSTTHGGTAAEATHYQTLTQQPIEIMQRLMTKEQFLGFCHGNVVKYALRCGHKDDPVKEMEKVRQYADWYVRASSGETIDPKSKAQVITIAPGTYLYAAPKAQNGMSWVDCVKEFNRVYGVEAPTKDYISIRTQLNLIREEITELIQASKNWEDVPSTSPRDCDARKAVLDAICDSVYVLIGLALKMGFDLDGAFREVHRSNMSKLGEDGSPICREDGKILKGPNFTPPDLEPYI